MVKFQSYICHLANTSVLSLLMLTFSFQLDAQVLNLFNIPFPEQYAVMDSLIDTLANSDSKYAENELKKLKAYSLEGDEALDVLNLRRSIIRYRYIINYKDQDIDSTKAIIEDATQFLEELDESEYPVIAALVHKTLGNLIDYKKFRYRSGFEHYIKAYNLFTEIPVAEFPDRQYAQYSIALAYFKFKDYEKSLVIAKELEELYPKKNYISMFTINLMGMANLELENYNDALRQFNWLSNNYFKHDLPPVWEGIIKGNKGQLFAETDKLDSAVTYLNEAIKITVAENETENVIRFASLLSSIYLDRSELDSALKYSEIAHKLTHQTSDIANLPSVYQSLSQCQRILGNKSLALAYQDTMMIFKDSLEMMNNVELKFKAELDIERQKSIQKEDIFNAESSRLRILRNSSIVFAAFFIIILALLYNRAMTKNRNEKKLLEIHELQIKGELELAKSQLEEFTSEITEKNLFIERAAEDLLKSRKTSRQKNETNQFHDEHNSALSDLRSLIISNDESWKNFIQLFEKVHPGFLLRLNNQYPNLAIGEVKFIALSKLKLQSKEMSLVLSVSMAAIRQTKSRVKKKLNIQGKVDLEHLLDQI